MYFEGCKIPQDYKQAAKWIVKASAQGFEKAQCLLRILIGDWQNPKLLYEGNLLVEWAMTNKFVQGEGLVHDIYVENYKLRAYEKWYAENYLASCCEVYEEEPCSCDIDQYPFSYKEANFNIGLIYFNGKYVKQDYKEAFKWWSDGAVYSNDLEGNLGRSYEEVSFAAKHKNVEAQFVLGVMYYMGESIPQDYKEATKLFTEAAKQGLAQAQIILGVMYECGQAEVEDLACDIVRVYQWYLLAGMKGADIVEDENSICEQMTDEEIAEAHLGFADLCHDGYNGSLDNFDFNHNRIVNYKEAAKWYAKAAEQGHIEAQLKLEKMHRLGEGVDKATEQRHIESTNQTEEQNSIDTQSQPGMPINDDDIPF